MPISCQYLSILFLNWFTDVASMTAWGSLFHSCTTRHTLTEKEFPDVAAGSLLRQLHAVSSQVVFTSWQLKELVSINCFSSCHNLVCFNKITSDPSFLQRGQSQALWSVLVRQVKKFTNHFCCCPLHLFHTIYMFLQVRWPCLDTVYHMRSDISYIYEQEVISVKSPEVSFRVPDCSIRYQNSVWTRSKNEKRHWGSVTLNGHIMRVVCCVTKILCGPMRFFCRSFPVLCSPLWCLVVP